MKKIQLSTPEKIIYPLEQPEINESNNSHRLKIGGKQYWKLTSQPNENAMSKSLQEFVDRKVADFKNAVKLVEEKGTNYNLAMASIKGKVFDRVEVDKDITEWIQQKRSMINDQLGSFSVISSGVSGDKIQITALAQPQMSNNFSFTEAVNRIRGDENEMAILDDIGLLESPNNYYVIDLYVEDLLEEKDTILIENVQLKINNKYISNIVNVESQEVTTILDQYNRQMNNNNKIQNKSWNLFLFENQYAVPDEILVQVKGEIIQLTK